MKTYEITYISRENLTDKADGGPVGKIISSLDGKILNTVSLGEKQFTYRIKKENKGYYTTLVFNILPEKILQLGKKLSLNPDVLRFLITIHKESAQVTEKTEAALKKPLKISEISKIAIEKSLKEVEKEKKPAKKTPKVEEKEVEKPATKPREIELDTEKEEDRLKALDKKLDELLKE